MSKIQLKPLEWKDWQKYLDWVNDGEIAKLIDRYLPVTKLEHQDFYKVLLKDKSRIFFSISQRLRGGFLGVCALKNIDAKNRKAELYICLNGKGVRGKGLGTQTVEELLKYAFDTLNLNRIYLYTPSYNKAAISCYKKTGFVREGEFLEDVYSDGRYYNTIRMCYLRKFRKAKRAKR